MAALARLLLEASYRSAGRMAVWRVSPLMASMRGRIEAFYGFRIPGTVQVQLHGRVLRLSGETWNGVASGVWWGGLAGFEPTETRLVAAVSPAYDVILDIGANIGWFSLVIASANPNVRVFAFEPNPDVAPLLEQNFKTNGVQGEILRQVISDRVGRVTFFQDRDDWASSLAERPGTSRALDVPSVTIDDFVSLNKIRPSFLKIDVEGAEEEVFRGAQRTLLSCSPDLLFEISPSISSVERLRAILLSCGYERFWTFASGRVVADHDMRLTKGRNTINYFSSVRLADASLRALMARLVGPTK